MPRRIQGVPPRGKDERAYLRWTRLNILQPLFEIITPGFLDAGTPAQAYVALDRITEASIDVPREDIDGFVMDMDEYHRRRMIQTFRTGAGIDITRFLTQPQVESFLQAKVTENVELIRTIPPRTRAGLADRLQRELREAPFDQQRLRGLLRAEYRSEGYNLRRITRDQTNKTIGQLTEIRQRQVGVTRYTWRTSQDERVRTSHASKNGLTFEWGRPPADTGHPGADIQCRCVALPIVDERV